MLAFQFKVARIGEPEPSPKLDQPELARDYWRDVIAYKEWFDPNKEHAVVLTLNTRYRITGFNLVSTGTINEGLVHPREVFRPVIVAGAYAFILMHNHPSGDPSPSSADHSLTRRIVESAELLQIKLLDHIIVGDKLNGGPDYFSFKEAGVI